MDQDISQILKGQPSLKPTIVLLLPNLWPMFSRISLLSKNFHMGSGMFPDEYPPNGTSKTRGEPWYHHQNKNIKRKFPNPKEKRIKPNFKSLLFILLQRIWFRQMEDQLLSCYICLHPSLHQYEKYIEIFHAHLIP